MVKPESLSELGCTGLAVRVPTRSPSELRFDDLIGKNRPHVWEEAGRCDWACSAQLKSWQTPVGNRIQPSLSV